MTTHAKDASPEKGEQGEEYVRIQRSMLKMAAIWLRAAISCKDFRWDWDQQEAADATCKDIEQLLSASPSVSAPDSQGAKGDGGKLAEELLGWNVLTEDEIDHWNECLKKLGTEVPAGCNVLCRMAKAALRQSGASSTEGE